MPGPGARGVRGFELIEFRKGRLSVRPLVISKAKYDFIDDSLMVFYTGLTRFASDIVKEQEQDVAAVARPVPPSNARYGGVLSRADRLRRVARRVASRMGRPAG